MIMASLLSMRLVYINRERCSAKQQRQTLSVRPLSR